MKKVISTDKAPSAIGPYSQGIACSNIIFTSGQLPTDPATGDFASDEIAGQTRQCLKNLSAVLEAEGLTLENVAKATVFLQDLSHFAAMNEVYSEFFSQNPPARSCVEVAALPKSALVEIEAIAVRNS